MIRDQIFMRFDGLVWRRTNQTNLQTIAPKRAELHNVNDVLFTNIPIPIEDKEFLPICKEFYNIDLILIGPDGYLILVECKNGGPTDWNKLQTQTLHRAYNHSKKSLHDILTYIEDLSKENNICKDSRSRFMEWRKNACYPWTTTIGELISKRKLLFMAMLEGSISRFSIMHSECGLIGCLIQFNFSRNEVRLQICYDLQRYYNISDKDLDNELRHQYCIYEMKEKSKSTSRKKIPVKVVERYFQSLPDNKPNAILYRTLRNRFQEVTAGTGKDAETTLTLRIAKGHAKAPFLLLRGEFFIELRSVNLSAHSHEFGVPASCVDLLSIDIQKIVSRWTTPHVTKRGYVHINFSTIDDKNRPVVVKKVIKRIGLFLDTV